LPLGSPFQLRVWILSFALFPPRPFFFFPSSYPPSVFCFSLMDPWTFFAETPARGQCRLVTDSYKARFFFDPGTPFSCSCDCPFVFRPGKQGAWSPQLFWARPAREPSHPTWFSSSFQTPSTTVPGGGFLFCHRIKGFGVFTLTIIFFFGVLSPLYIDVHVCFGRTRSNSSEVFVRFEPFSWKWGTVFFSGFASLGL